MKKEEITKKLIDAYAGYYNMERAKEGLDKVPPPFDAIGFFANEAQQYFLVKSARIAEVNSYEHVYFRKCDKLDRDMLAALDKAAWEDGIAKVDPHPGHKNTDVALIVIADELAAGVREAVSAFKHSRNYKFGLYGFSNYRLVVIEAHSGLILTNRRGEDLRSFVTHIINK